MSKRVLVTGGAGFISSNFICHLLEETDHEVVTLDALTYAGNLENLADVMSHPRLSFVHGDIRDAKLVRELIEGVDVIVNAAAESHVEKSIEHGASEFVTTNVEGTQILLDAIRATPVERFILISSSEVYGTAESAPMDEEHALKPRSPYAATKAGADRLAYSYWTTYDLPIVIVRPFNNYGPRQHPEKVVPRFITQALADEPLTIHGDGHASRDWLYVNGFKIRVPPSPLWTSMFKAFGAAPASINFSETYSALQTRLVDGQENPLAIIDVAKLYEVQKYLSVTNHMWDGFWFLANKKAWDAIPADTRGVVEAEFNASAVTQREDIAKLNATLQGSLQARGMEFIATDAALFRAALKKAGFYAEWKEKYGAEAWKVLEDAVGGLA